MYAMANREVDINSATRNQSDFGAKLRRLKIEESILLENLNKNISACSQIEDEINPVHILTNSEFRKYSAAIKKSYSDIKQMFQDLKASTSSKDGIMTIDIDELKKNTLDLENKIKSFKLYLSKELNDLKFVEKEINLKLSEPMSISCLKTKPRTRTAKYIEIVSSPVKATMNSPFKNSEVQAFQEFMSHSKNRYGGWAEYHHNIFVNMWQKHIDNSVFSDETISTISNTAEFKSFICELLSKVQGVSVEDIISHARWYISYLHLKNRQQEAIDKWRLNKHLRKSTNMKSKVDEEISTKGRTNKLKKRTKSDKKDTDIYNRRNTIESGDKSGSYARKCLSDTMLQEYCSNNPNNKDHRDMNFLKATREWTIRSTSKENKNNEVCNIENIRKLRIPLWRAHL